MNPNDQKPIHSTSTASIDQPACDGEVERDARPTDGEYDFPVVGIGASAGGLESLEKLFARVPSDSGMAYVVVQHLSPDFRSVMDELLARQTDIPIRQAEEGLEVVPNTIFLIPPKKEAILSGRRFRLRDKEPREALTLPIDHFFRSLAQEAGPRAIAIVLSGSGSDGSRGIRDVRQAGGLVVCETEETAKFDGMPMAAQETGVVDLVLRPELIPEAIIRHAKNDHAGSGELGPVEDLFADGIDLVFKLLHAEYGIDFSYYKSSTVGRRIQRRLAMHQSTDIEEYASRLSDDPVELNSLYRDLLIGVTHFFRDPAAFEELEEKIIPELVERASEEEELRIWVAGCATGEEAYSIAILLHECFTKRGRPPTFKLFATDVHNRSLELASTGEYGGDSIVGVSEERLQRYFERQGESFIVVPELRKLIVFAPHNLLKDAPFTKLDMITCRNLLIYFQPLAQKKALSLFQFGLKTGGVLFLGPSESPGELLDEFDPLDSHWKMFRKRRDTRLPANLRMQLPLNRFALPRSEGRQAVSPSGARGGVDAVLLRTYDWILAKHMPPAVLIDDRHQILHIFGSADSFLHLKAGRPSSDALELFEGGLRMAVMGAMQRIRKEGGSIYYDGVQADSGKSSTLYRVGVETVENPKATRAQFLITIAPSQPAPTLLVHSESPTDVQSLSQDRIDALESDLRFAQENLQATVEELETANEELQAANEELIASNEELQSTNEELHSVNEELYTVNAEYQKKIYELTELSADMENLMECTDVATVFLDRDLRIRKFTPQIVPIFKLLSQDIGRCIDNFAHFLLRDGLIPAIHRVIETGVRLEEEIQTIQGRWLFLRVLPYRSEKVVKGVALTLIDVDTLKRAERSLAEAVKDREGFLAVLSHELRNPVNAVLSASHLLENRPDLAAQDQATAVIQRQSKHIARLLEDLLDVSRMTQNKLELRMKSFDLRKAIDAAIETANPAIVQHGQLLKADIPEGPMFVYGDEHRLSQVIVNLMVNAAKYSPAGGIVRLSVKAENSEVLIQVADNGNGIPADSLESIFKPFNQSSRTRRNRDGGMGVGLSLAKSIVERHFGGIKAHSDGEGKGSEFSVTLPLVTPPIDGYHHSKPLPDSRAVQRIERKCGPVQLIVIVEDQSDNREMLRKILSVKGYNVKVAKDGEEGIELIVTERPQAAIVDLGLPSVNGYGVAKNVRARLGDQILMIALTGHGSPEDIEAALEAGFDDHMVKPLDLDRLHTLLQAQS